MRGFAKLVAVVSLLAGCGLNMEKNYQKMRPDMVSGNYEAADKYLDSVKENFYAKDNRLLYYMDKGMVLHLGKKYQQSNQFLEKAKTAAEELWTESISKNALAWVTTDNSVPYQGEDFEKVLIHFVAALNYVSVSDLGSARVEARQVSQKLELYAQKYAELDPDSAGKMAYVDDAFARWMSGKLRETDPEMTALNDAWIDYKKALTIYEKDYAARYKTAVPLFLVQDALRALEGLGSSFKDELAQLKGRYPSVTAQSRAETKGMGEVILVHLSGEAPYKIDKFWDSKASNGDFVRIAYPEFVPKPYRIKGARLSAAAAKGETETAENITAIALQNLNDRMARIKAKAIARALVKYLASKGIGAAGEKAGGKAGAGLQVAGALMQFGSAVAEESDKRSWITLPAVVNVGRIFLPPGEHTVNVEFLGAGGETVGNAQLKTTVEAGKPSFVTYRTYQ
jgi:uncharacterized protein